MEIYSLTELLQFVCANTGKYGMAVSFLQTQSNDEEQEENILNAAPWISSDQHTSLLNEGVGIVLFDSQKEAELAFRETSLPVCCTTCNPEGELEYDNLL